MKTATEKLWEEYLSDKCAVITTDEERALIKRASELHEAMSRALTKGQGEAVDKYVDALNEIQAFFSRKAFSIGCELGVSFFLETAFLSRRL